MMCICTCVHVQNTEFVEQVAERTYKEDNSILRPAAAYAATAVAVTEQTTFELVPRSAAINSTVSGPCILASHIVHLHAVNDASQARSCFGAELGYVSAKDILIAHSASSGCHDVPVHLVTCALVLLAPVHVAMYIVF